ncbi:uncharacterized protein LOC142225262 [Haematobia irritans]|uniref:uncharacterized protein LOC142225262 n=1 Tax=Haematobia irritans TaxID=7368 RepID=UPI003F501A66
MNNKTKLQLLTPTKNTQWSLTFNVGGEKSMAVLFKVNNHLNYAQCNLTFISGEPSTPPITESVPTDDIDGTEAASKKQQKPVRPPPIIVSSMENFGALRNVIKSKAANGFITKQIDKQSQKISTFEANDYREVTKALNEAKIQWHSYENKHDRPIRVIAKNLHHTCDPIDIITDLKEQGFNIINAFNKTHYYTKDPLDLFVLSFHPTENIQKIYDIKQILNTISRCARCAGKHETKTCEKPSVFLPKCCNCGEQHPASYRGCIVAKELQKLRNQKLKNQNRNANSNKIPQQVIHKSGINSTVPPLTRNNTARGGSAILIKKSIKHWPENTISLEEFQVTTSSKAQHKI